MFGKILGKTKEKDSENLEIQDKISKMTLSDMRAYLKNNMGEIKSCEDGLVAVMNRLLTKNEETLKRYIEIDDMDSKKKKGFEIVLSIASHKKITITSVEQIQKFIELYEDIILKYDTEHKQIYGSKLTNSLQLALSTIQIKTDINRKANVLA